MSIEQLVAETALPDAATCDNLRVYGEVSAKQELDCVTRCLQELSENRGGHEDVRTGEGSGAPGARPRAA